MIFFGIILIVDHPEGPARNEPRTRGVGLIVFVTQKNTSIIFFLDILHFFHGLPYPGEGDG